MYPLLSHNMNDVIFQLFTVNMILMYSKCYNFVVPQARILCEVSMFRPAVHTVM